MIKMCCDDNSTFTKLSDNIVNFIKETEVPTFYEDGSIVSV